jgi:hypothetical protein
MNLAASAFSSEAAGTSPDYPVLCGTIDDLFPALVLRPSEKVFIHGEAPVSIVDEALLALQQVGWPKGPRHVQHMYIGQSDTREAVTLADCWSHQPGRRSTMPASALSRSAGSRLVHRSLSGRPRLRNERGGRSDSALRAETAAS